MVCSGTATQCQGYSFTWKFFFGERKTGQRRGWVFFSIFPCLLNLDKTKNSLCSLFAEFYKLPFFVLHYLYSCHMGTIHL